MQAFDKILDDALTRAIAERGHINILIAGRSGVGKSTLINAVFQANLAETGQGRPVTKTTREITREGVPLTLFDTRGLEMSEFEQTLSELDRVVGERCADRDANRHIHIAWLCIQEDGRRVEEAEVILHERLARHVPVMAVVTKARADQGFRAEVQKLLPEARNVVRVRAIEEWLDEGIRLPPMGLETLIEAVSELIPEGTRRALAAAQKASIEYKKKQAHKAVVGAVTAASVAGATPVPLSDAAILIPIQIGMLASITSIFGLEMTKATLSTLLSSGIGVTGATFTGRSIVSNLLKLMPGVGTITGGVLSATTAGALTLALGEAYISVLSGFFMEGKGTQTDFLDTLMEKYPSALAEKLQQTTFGTW